MLLVIRRLCWLLLAAIVLVVVVDAGLVVFSRISVHEDVRAAGRAGSIAVEGLPTTPGTAAVALRVAEVEAQRHGLRLKRRAFLLYAGGTVELTGSRTASTLVLQRIGPLRHLADVQATATVRQSPYG